MDGFGDVGGRTGFLDNGEEGVNKGLVFADAGEVGGGAACLGEGGDGGAGLERRRLGRGYREKVRVGRTYSACGDLRNVLGEG